MSKIGIINCYNESKICSSFGCFKAFNDRGSAFEDYDKDTEVICFVHCNGCSDDSIKQVMDRANSMKKRGVTTIHLATCIKIKCPWSAEFIKALSGNFDIISYTHEVHEN
jgi:predicted metal-binding protein